VKDLDFERRENCLVRDGKGGRGPLHIAAPRARWLNLRAASIRDSAVEQGDLAAGLAVGVSPAETALAGSHKQGPRETHLRPHVVQRA